MRAIFNATDRAAAILGTDPAMRRRIAEATAKLPPLKVGPDGRLLDGATNGGWRSWARGTPSAKTLTVDMYPDLTEFNPSDLCPVPGFTVRGRQAFLYSAMNSNVVDRHFLWMKDYGLDGVLIQRFVTQHPRAPLRRGRGA